MGIRPFKNQKTAAPTPEPQALDPLRGRPYGAQDTSEKDDQLAAGQLALATIETPNQRRKRLGLDPINETGWH